jgi:hypothetical protein
MMSSYMLAARRCQHIEAGTPFLEYPELLDAVSSVRHAQISTMPSIFPNSSDWSARNHRSSAWTAAPEPRQPLRSLFSVRFHLLPPAGEHITVKTQRSLSIHRNSLF